MNLATFTDEQYFNLSDEVYKNDTLTKGRDLFTKDGSHWKVINSVDKQGSGLQAIAVVPAKEYKKGKTSYANAIFVARGSEPNAKQFMKDWIHTDVGKLGIGQKPETDRKLKKAVGQPSQTVADFAKKWSLPGKGIAQLPAWYSNTDNQFYDYQVFVNQTLKDYQIPNYTFTGHSLGGALSQYMGVQKKKKTVTYAAANPFRLLTKEQQEAVENGDFDSLITDYRHRLDPVGKIVPGGMVIGKQFIMDMNSDVSLGSYIFMGHLKGTFAGMFTASGSAKLKVNPDMVIQQARRLDDVLAIMQQTQYRMQDLEEEVSKRSRKLRADLEDDTREGARFSELTVWDVDEALTERAVKYHGGVYTFHDPAKFEAFYALNEQQMRRLRGFQEELIQAAESIREKDISLGDWIAHNQS